MAGPPKAFVDLYKLPEDERIAVIGRLVMVDNQVVGVFVDDQPPDKADRYVRKLSTDFPGIRLLARFAGPVSGVITLKFGPPEETK